MGENAIIKTSPQSSGRQAAGIVGLRKLVLFCAATWSLAGDETESGEKQAKQLFSFMPSVYQEAMGVGCCIASVSTNLE